MEKPTYVTANTELEGKDNVNLPSISVIVPLEALPCSMMLAPIIGSPLLSTTVPLTIIFLPIDFFSTCVFFDEM